MEIERARAKAEEVMASRHKPPLKTNLKGYAPYGLNTDNHGVDAICEPYKGSLSAMTEQDLESIIELVLDKLASRGEFIMVGTKFACQPSPAIAQEARHKNLSLTIVSGDGAGGVADGQVWVNCWFYPTGSVGFDLSNKPDD